MGLNDFDRGNRDFGSPALNLELLNPRTWFLLCLSLSLSVSKLVRSRKAVSVQNLLSSSSTSVGVSVK